MHAERVINFGAGPAALPTTILQQAQAELLNWQGLGMSVMEVSHRSPEFKALLEQTTALLRQVLAIPSQYKVFFMHGPARAQFAMVPLNLTQLGRADYAVTGMWSKLAATEAQPYTAVNIATDSSSNQYTDIAPLEQWTLSESSDFLYYTDNETVNGLAFHRAPVGCGKTLVCDMTSSLLSRSIDVSQYGLIFAGAQKNIAPAGMSLAIVHEQLLTRQSTHIIPQVLDYALLSEKQSLLYTPPSFCIYMANKMLNWVVEQGGVKALEQVNREKAKRLYDFIDNSALYNNRVEHKHRSMMNIPFQLRDEALDSAFLSQAKANGLVALKGHRSVGGMRASLYNAISIKEVDALIQFMQKFELQQG